MTDERLQRLEAQVAAHREVLIALAAALPEGEARECFRTALDGLLTVKEQSEDPGLDPDGAYAHEYRFAEVIRSIIEGSEARSR